MATLRTDKPRVTSCSHIIIRKHDLPLLFRFELVKNTAHYDLHQLTSSVYFWISISFQALENFSLKFFCFIRSFIKANLSCELRIPSLTRVVRRECWVSSETRESRVKLTCSHADRRTCGYSGSVRNSCCRTCSVSTTSCSSGYTLTTIIGSASDEISLGL